MNRIKDLEQFHKSQTGLLKGILETEGSWEFGAENEGFGCESEKYTFDLKQVYSDLRSYRENPQIAALQLRIASLEDKVKQQDELLRDFLRMGEPIARNPIEEWFTAHPADREKYKGQQIAFQNGVGIVASAVTGNELVAKVKELGLLDQVEFGVAAVASV